MVEKKGIWQEMASFTKNGRPKSSFFVYVVCLSFLFIAAHVTILSLLLGPIHDHFTALTPPLTGGWLNLFESGIPALLSAVLCNLPFFFIRDKRLILAAYALILLYAAVIVIAVLCAYEEGAKAAFMTFFWTVIPAPVLCGLIVSGGVYAAYSFRKNR